MTTYDVTETISQMEIELIASMKRNLARHQKEVNLVGFDFPQWQRLKIQGFAKFHQENARIVHQYMNNAENMTGDVIKMSFLRGARKVDKELKGVMNRKIDKLTDINNANSFFNINSKRINVILKAVKHDYDKVAIATLRKMDDTYRQVVFKAHLYKNMGAKTLYQAVDMSAKDFYSTGINSITYKDGRNVNIVSYTEMAIRTTSQRASFKGGGFRRDEWGVRTILTSQHSNTCPKCLYWQGRVLIDDVYSNGTSRDGKYPLLSTAIAGGFMHPNCRHNLGTYYEGINTIPTPLTTAEEKQAVENYNAEKKQRYNERQIRKWKRIEVGNLNSTDVATAHQQVLNWQAKQRDLIKQNSYLRRDYWRENI